MGRTSYLLHPIYGLTIGLKLTVCLPSWTKVGKNGEDQMKDIEKINLLEAALIKYVELYGFIDEARAYYIQSGTLEDRLDKRVH